MRYVDRVAIVLALGPGWLCSDRPPAEQPTTQPAVPTSRILILPFAIINGSDASPWLGKSDPAKPRGGPDAVGPGAAALCRHGSKRHRHAYFCMGEPPKADFVVIGSFTTLDAPTGAGRSAGDLSGKLVDVAHETGLSGFKATGMYADIFQLEDQIGKQIRRRLSDAGAIQIPMIVVGPSAVADSQPVEVAQAPTINEYEQAYGNPQPMVGGANDSGYNYYYGNPYTSGGFDSGCGFGFPLVIYGGNGFFGRGSRGFGGFHWQWLWPRR